MCSLLFIIKWVRGIDKLVHVFDVFPGNVKLTVVFS